MKLLYHGHACFSVDCTPSKSHPARLLFDPFFTSNPSVPKARKTPAALRKIPCDYLLVSHGHFDHIEDAASIASRSGARVLAGFEVGQWLQNQGVAQSQIQPFNLGGTARFPFGSVQMVSAVHSSSLPDGSYGGVAAGFVVRTPKASFYYSGDTALTLDMQWIPRKGPLRFAVLCLGDAFTMGPEDALEAARLIECDDIVGVHFDTWPPLKINHAAAKRLFAKAGKTLHLPKPGDLLSFD
jgi:L-ascorbate metabolism protein UlaG (beta-lactamase superfamily)